MTHGNVAVGHQAQLALAVAGKQLLRMANRVAVECGVVLSTEILRPEKPMLKAAKETIHLLNGAESDIIHSGVEIEMTDGRKLADYLLRQNSTIFEDELQLVDRKQRFAAS